MEIWVLKRQSLSIVCAVERETGLSRVAVRRYWQDPDAAGRSRACRTKDALIYKEFGSRRLPSS